MSNKEITPGNNKSLPQEQKRANNEQDSLGEIVKLGDEFVLFAPSRTGPLWDKPEEGLATKIGIIAQEGDTPIPFDIRLMKTGSGLSKMLFITPLEPSAGYEFSDEDLDPVQRIEKYEALRQQANDPTKAAFSLHLDSKSKYFLDSGLSNEKPHTATYLPIPSTFKLSEFKPEVLDRLKQLRLQVTFPTGQSYEGRPSELGLVQGRVVIDSFYWLESPPPVSCADWDMTNTLVADWRWPGIAVPDTESMQGVKGRFFFTESNELRDKDTTPSSQKDGQNNVVKQKEAKKEKLPEKAKRSWQRFKDFMNEPGHD